MRADDSIRLLHMIKAGEEIAHFLAGRQRHDLDTNRMLLLAVVRLIEVIGEERRASRLKPEAWLLPSPGS